VKGTVDGRACLIHRPFHPRANRPLNLRIPEEMLEESKTD
jgi:hypothetical protein